MKSVLISIVALSSFYLGAPAEPSPTYKAEAEDLCRVTYTVYIEAMPGVLVGVSASAGNFFTSCEEAGRRAREKAYGKALAMLAGI
jgi:hypothetical protein